MRWIGKQAARLASLPLRVHLALFVILLMIPVTAEILVSAYLEQKVILAWRSREASSTVNFLAGEQADLIAGAQQLGLVLSQLQGVRSRHTAATRELLQDLLTIYPQFGNIVIADASGKVWVSALEGPAGVSIADRRYFVNSMATKRFSSGEYTIGKYIGKPLLGFGIPLLSEHGTVDGVVGLSFNLAILDRFLEEEESRKRGMTLTLLDHRGVILFCSDRPARFVGQDERSDLFRKIVAGPDTGNFEDREDPEGRSRVFYRKLRLEGEAVPYQYVCVSFPMEPALAQARKGVLFRVVLFSIFALGGIFAALHFGKYFFVDRIRALSDTARSIAAGDFAVRATEKVQGGELGALASSLDSLARELDAREKARADAVRELLAGRRRYRALFHGANDAIFVHPVVGEGEPGVFIEVNDRACQQLGYSRKELLRMTPQDIDAPEFRANIAEVGRRLAENGEAIFESGHVRKDGRVIPVEINARLVTVDGETLVYSVCRQLGGRKSGGATGTALKGTGENGDENSDRRG